MTSKRTLLVRLTVMLVLVAMLVPVFAACGKDKSNVSYTITYHLNGGAFAKDAVVPEKYQTGDEAQALPTPTKEDATFLGWYDISEPNTKTDTKYTKVPTDKSEDLEFFAIWAEPGDYTITFHLNGGTFTKDVRTSYSTGEEAWSMPIPERVGYNFQGWCDNADFDEGDYYSTVPTDSMGPLEFWADWSVITYTVTLNVNGGKLTGADRIAYIVEDGKIKLPTPTGDTAFLGWYTSPSFLGEKLTEWDASRAKNTQLYAKWERAKRVLTFDANGGVLEDGNTLTYTNDKGVIELPTPTKSGKYFVAWYADASFSSAPMWSFRTSQNVNMTLYAKWADTEAAAAAVRAAAIVAPADITIDADSAVLLDFEKSSYGQKKQTEDGQTVAKFDLGTKGWTRFNKDNKTLVTSVNFSEYNTVEFSIYSEKATGAKFGIVLVSEVNGNALARYAQIPVTVDWEGEWKTFSVPYSALTGKAFSSKTEGFVYAGVTNDGWGYEENLQPGTVVYITSVRVVKTPSKLNLDITEKDLEGVKENIKKDLIGDETLITDSTALVNLNIPGKDKIQQWIQSMDTTNTTKLWSDLSSPVSSGDVNGQYCGDYFERIYSMAKAYAIGSYRTEENMDAINRALDWMYQYAYNPTVKASGNWWNWEIGAALPLVRTLLIIENDMNATTKANCLKALNRFTPVPKYTYANRSWTGYTALYAAILRKDIDGVKKCMEELLQCFEYSAMTSDRDGFFPDGSFIQHKYTPYITSYGTNYLSEMTAIIYSLQGTELALDQAYIDQFFSFFLNSYAPMLYQGNAFAGCFGRNGLGGYDGKDIGCKWMAYIIRILPYANQTDQVRINSLFASIMKAQPNYATAKYMSPPAIANYRAFQKAYKAGQITASEELGAYMMTASDRVIQKTATYAALVAMSSTRIYRYEAINNSNGWGWCLGDGVLYVVPKSKPDTYSSNFFKGLKNKTLLPGVTTTNKDRNGAVYDVDNNPFGAYSVVGGVSDNALNPLYSMAYMHFGADQKPESYKDGTPEDLDLKKAWFFFDNEIVCLGSGITSTTSSEVFTVMDNRYVGNSSCAIYWNGDEANHTVSETLNNASWVHFNQFGGYYFPEATTVDMKRNATNENGFVRFTLNHGTKPTNASYAYVMLPDMTKANVKAYSEAPDVEVLSNTSYVSAVREKKLGMTGIAFWEANQKFAVGDVAITAANACAVMLTEGGNATYTLSVSEPTQLRSSLTITLDGVWNVSANENMTVKTVNGNTVITVYTSGALGATFTCTISK